MNLKYDKQAATCELYRCDVAFETNAALYRYSTAI